MPEFSISIEGRPNGEGGHTFGVTTDLTSRDELITLLLMTVENMTGVSTDGYVAEVDQHRMNLAAREEADRA